MNDFEFADQAASFMRILQKDALQLHDETVLILMDISTGVEIDQLRDRISMVLASAYQMNSHIKELNCDRKVVLLSHPDLRNKACQKCLLQLGEVRELPNSA